MPAAWTERPVNLTVLADRMSPIGDGRLSKATRILTLADLVFEIHAGDGAGQMALDPGLQDEIYVVIAGFGAVRCADGDLIEFTAGDLLFVPADSEARLEGLSPKFRAWRISVGSAKQPLVSARMNAPE